MSERIPVEELSYGCIDITPVERDWTARYDEDGEASWSYWEAFDYEDGPDGWTLISHEDRVVAAFTAEGDKIDLEELDDFNDLKVDPDEVRRLGEVEPSQWGSEGPMMNYSYGLGGDRSDRVGGYGNTTDAIGAAYRIRDLPLCLVEIEDEMHLALTGGGMDLSWEIVEAYTALGQLPPVHFDLPAMSGRGENERDRYLIAAVDRSLASMVERMQSKLERHRRQFRDPGELE